MDALTFLGTTAEIAATFAGFISIFVALARRDGSFEPTVAFLIRLVLIGSVLSLFFAALPLILASSSVPEPLLWRLSSGGMLAAGVGVTAYVVRHRVLIQRTVLVPIAYALNGMAFLGLAANAVAWPIPSSGGIHLASVWLILGIASVNFVDLVFHHLLAPPTN